MKLIMNKLEYSKKSEFDIYTKFVKHKGNITYNTIIGLDDNKIQINLWAINNENGDQYSQVYWSEENELEDVIIKMEKHVKSFLKGVIG